MVRFGLYALIVVMFAPTSSALAAPRYRVLRQPHSDLFHAPLKPVYEEESVYRAPYAWGWFGAHGHSPGRNHRDYYGDTWRFGVWW
jgi:hypothetical protein